MNKDYKMNYDNFLSNEDRKNIVKRNIIELRNNAGLTQKETAELLEVNQQTYNAYETGRTTPPIEILIRMSYLYELPVDIIVDRDNNCYDTEKQRKQLDEFEKEIAEQKKRLKNANPEEKERINQFINGIEQMLNALK